MWKVFPTSWSGTNQCLEVPPPITAFPSWSHMALGGVHKLWGNLPGIRSLDVVLLPKLMARWGCALLSMMIVPLHEWHNNGLENSIDEPFSIQVALQDDYLCAVHIRDAFPYHDTPSVTLLHFFRTHAGILIKGKFSSGIEGALVSTLNLDFNWKQLSEMILCIFFFYFFLFE